MFYHYKETTNTTETNNFAKMNKTVLEPFKQSFALKLICSIRNLFNLTSPMTVNVVMRQSTRNETQRWINFVGQNIYKLS